MRTDEAHSPRPYWLDAWHVNPSANRDYDFIDGLRGVAILMVVIGHYFYINPEDKGPARFVSALISTGSFGVTLFFALSGFLISWPFWKRKVQHAETICPPGYGWRRFWKIYPPLALSVLFFASVKLVQTHDWSFAILAAKWLAGVPALFPVSGKLNPVMWTLVVEVQFYLLLPVLFLCLRRASLRASFWIITLIFLAAPVSMRGLTGARPEFFPDINSHFPSALDGFYLGVLIAGFDNLGWLKKCLARLGDAGAVMLAAAVMLNCCVNLHPEWASTLTLEGLGALVKISAGGLLLYIADARAPGARLLCLPWLRWCGIISYEWYLFHHPISFWARNVFGPAGGSRLKYAAIVGGSLCVSLVLSAAVYRCFSLPLLKRGRSKHQRQ